MFLHSYNVANKRCRRGYADPSRNPPDTSLTIKLLIVYAYVPTSQPGFCTESGITCNPDYGTSLARGSFSFVTGQWQTIWLMVILNELGTANGVVEYVSLGPRIDVTDLAVYPLHSVTWLNSIPSHRSDSTITACQQCLSKISNSAPHPQSPQSGAYSFRPFSEGTIHPGRLPQRNIRITGIWCYMLERGLQMGRGPLSQAQGGLRGVSVE
jgi:hypothetical protein